MSNIISVITFIFPRLRSLLSPCIIIIALLLLQKFYFKDYKKMLLYMIFSLYLLSVFRITKLPDSLRLHFNPRIQLIPFYGIHKDLFNSALNIFLFVPFGFFLPALWRHFFSFKNTVITALCFTAFIEISQLFCNRLTDINDIIMNTLGAVIGYCILLIITKPFPKLFQHEFKKRECVLIFAITFSMAFFLDPIIYHLLKDIQKLPSSYAFIVPLGFITSRFHSFLP